MKRIAICFCALLLILSSLLFSFAEGDVENIGEIQRFINEHIGEGLIPVSIEVDGFTMLFNMSLYRDKRIMVYGDYMKAMSLKGKNDFSIPKDKNGNLINESSYYVHGGRKGEYRYHGFALNGELYYNNDFPRDSDSGRTVSQKTWIYHYWVEQNEEMHDATLDANTSFNEHQDLIRKAIDAMIDDELPLSTNMSAPRASDGQGFSVADHMNVYTINSSIFNGEGKMMQRNGGRLWYQMFSTETAKSKTTKGQDISIEILDKGNYEFDSNGQTTIRVEVTGWYKDKDIVTDSDKIIYYHLGEMRHIHLGIEVGSKEMFVELRPNHQVDGNSGLTHTFEMVIDEGDIEDGGLVVKASSYSEFAQQNTSVGIVNDEVTATAIDSIGGGLKSLFDVPDISLSLDPIDPSQALPLGKEQVIYNDFSIGDIKKYSIQVTNTVTNRNESFLYEGSSQNFSVDLYNFLKTEPKYEIYEVIQTVSNDNTYNTSRDTFKVIKEVKKAIELDLDIPTDVIDIDPVQAVDATNYSVLGYQSRELLIDGIEVDWDTFFSGQYTYGERTQEKLSIIEISIVSDDGVEAIYKTAILVHTSLPRTKLMATGTLKENRKVTLINDSSSLVDDFVEAKYPTSYIITYDDVDGQMSNWKRNIIDENHIEMLFKKVGFYKATITATNTAGRSTSTDYHIGIVPDFEPNVYFNIWNNVLTRDEKLNITYSADSLDGDEIESNTFKIYFDEDEDGTAEKLVYESENELGDYTPSKLGYYLIVNDVVEKMNGETIEAFISESDIRKRHVERMFYVDNLRPLVEIDLDVPEDFEQVDLYILSDENYNDVDIAKLKENRVNYNNDLRLYGLDVKAEYRDLKTYVHTQAVDTSVYFASRVPPVTYDYMSNGYKGTITKYNQTNNPYEDYTETVESYESCSTRNITRWVNCDWGSDTAGCVISIGTSACQPYFCDEESKTIRECETEYRTVRDYYTVNRYTGYYRGTAYKYVKQLYADPFRETADKYVIYVADEHGINLSDYEALKELADFKVILIGHENLRDAVDNEMLFIKDDGSDINDLMKKAIDEIGKNYPFSSQYLVTIDAPFTINQIIYDTEGDAINNYGYQYVHEEVFDNPMGQASFARSVYSLDSAAYDSFKATSFSKAGLYRIYSLLKDQTNQSSFDKLSNVSQVSILAHRKPIADYELDWTYIPEEQIYQTTFVDKSYDPDHEYSDGAKGIRDVKAKYRLSTSNRWIYSVPNRLKKGTYEFSYSVKDLEGAWSEPKISTFTLLNVPPPQILEGRLKSTSSRFSLTSLPASEKVTFHDVKTRYASDVKIIYELYNTISHQYVPLGTQVLNTSVDQKNGQDIQWSPKTFAIPSSFPDGNHQVRLRVVDKTADTIFADKLFDLTIKTPVNLKSDFNSIIGEDQNSIYATTSIYASSVNLRLFSGDVPVQMTLISELTTSDTKTWVYVYDASGLSRPEGSYQAGFTARTDNGREEVLIKSFELVYLRILDVRVWGDWNHWRGQVDKVTGEILEVDPLRFMSHENIHIEVDVVGEPDEVVVDMSEPLKQMTYINSYGHVYHHREFGFPEVVYPLALSTEDLSLYTTEIILPLAKSTKDYDDNRKSNKYQIIITARKGSIERTFKVEIDLTGNIHDLIYLQPME